jgi:oligopeptide/dipeptide ABC transporter ATP-binding protein
MQPLLEIQSLKTWFPIRQGLFAQPRNHIRAVDGVSLTIGKGETLGLVGESGCGKSTLARTIMRLEPITEGSITFQDRQVDQLSGKPLKNYRRDLQIVFQDPFSSLNPRMNVMDIITEGMIEHNLIKRTEREKTARKLLDDVGLGQDALYRYPHEFSGGQRQRISIARALSLKPRLIICDEAVSALDVSIQAQVINLLMDLRDKYELAYLFISHDLSVVRHISHRVAVMYLGRIVETGPSDQVINNPLHPYTQALISAIPRIDKNKRKRIVLRGDVPSPANPPEGCRFHPRCPRASDICRNHDPELKIIKHCDHRYAACLKIDAGLSTTQEGRP